MSLDEYQVFAFSVIWHPSSDTRVQRLPDRQKIAPREPLLQRRTQQVSRVESSNGANFAGAGVIDAPATARPADALRNAEQCGAGGAAEAHQDVGIGELDLALDKGQANLAFLRCRR